MNRSGFEFGVVEASSTSFELFTLILTLTLVAQVVGNFISPKVRWARTSLSWVFGATSLAAIACAIFQTSADTVSVYLGLSGLESSRAISVGIGLDLSSALMVALVSFLGWMILRFSFNYLRSEKAQSRFARQLSWTVIAVELFALATSLLSFAVFWVLISWSVHKLLRHYDERPVARLAAKKKFLLSRVADVIFWASLASLFSTYGTLDLQELAGLASSSPAHEIAMTGICIAAVMKSAQFPLHTWLPDTMDAPTPVSAIMHAGVINAGAYLLLRLSPLLEHSPWALLLLAVVGGITAAFGIIVGSLQPSVKVTLAYSTIAQMGFLFFELGLGFPGAAALHLAAHGLYKAHSFLRSGSVTQSRVPTRYSFSQALALITLGLGISGALFGLGAPFIDVDPIAYLPLAAVWGLGASQYLLASDRTWGARFTSFFAVGVTLWVFAMTAEALLGSLFTKLPPLVSFGFQGPAAACLVVLLLTITLIVSTRGRYEGARLEKLYVYALSGFYLTEHFNRLTHWLWPEKPSALRSPLTSKGIS